MGHSLTLGLPVPRCVSREHTRTLTNYKISNGTKKRHGPSGGSSEPSGARERMTVDTFPCVPSRTLNSGMPRQVCRGAPEAELIEGGGRGEPGVNQP